MSCLRVSDCDAVRTQPAHTAAKYRSHCLTRLVLSKAKWIDNCLCLANPSRLIFKKDERFGLIEDRQSAINLESREVHWSAVKDRTVDFAGLMATRGIVKKTIQGFGGRIAAKQVTKFIPLGGQLVAATMGYTIFKKIANDHINECYKLAKDIQQKEHGKNV